MRVISYRAIRQFSERFPESAEPLLYWYHHTLAAEWRNFSDVRRSTFGQTDQVRVASGQTVLVFDIGGNKFRLIAGVSYQKGKVYVLQIMTHKEYDKDLWKRRL